MKVIVLISLLLCSLSLSYAQDEAEFWGYEYFNHQCFDKCISHFRYHLGCDDDYPDECFENFGWNNFNQLKCANQNCLKIDSNNCQNKCGQLGEVFYDIHSCFYTCSIERGFIKP